MKIKTTVISAEMCECGRLYKDCTDETGKAMCSACFTGLEREDLKLLLNQRCVEWLKESIQSLE